MTVVRFFRRTVGIASIAALLTAGLIAPPAQASWHSEPAPAPAPAVEPAPVTMVTVTYDSQADVCPESATVVQGLKFDLPTAGECTLTGYNLAGWASSSTGNAEFLPGTHYTAPNKITLYAVWSQNEAVNIVTYISDDTSSPACTEVVELGANATLSTVAKCSLERRLVGWNTESDFTGTQYYAPSAVWPQESFKLDGVGQSVSLYAQWGTNCPTVVGKKTTPAATEGVQWAGCDLTGAYLFNKNLAGANLNGANLTNANLIRAILTKAKLNGADLSKAKLNGADLNGADLNGAKIKNADLTGATLKGVSSGGIRFGGSSTLPSKWKVVAGYLMGPGANLTGADLSGADLSGVDLTKAKLNGADLTKAKLNGADLSGAKLDGADLYGAKLNGADLSGVDLKNVSSGGIRSGGRRQLPSKWKVVAGYLMGPGANLTGADLSGEDLSGMDLTGTNLTGTNLTKARLRGANLAGAILTRTNLTNANLYGADLTDTDLTGTNLTAVRWSNTTCPDGTVTDTARPGIPGRVCFPVQPAQT